MPEALGELGACRWPSATLRIGRRGALLPILVLAAAMVLVAFDSCRWRSPSSAPRVILLLAQLLTLREAYDAIDWPILVMLGALIPVSEALRTTGGTELIAGWLSPLRRGCRPLGLWRSSCRRHGGDAVPQQCGDGADVGADRGLLRRQARL